MVIVSPHLQAEVTGERIDLAEASAERSLETFDSFLRDHQLADDDICPRSSTWRSERVKVAVYARPRSSTFGVSIQVFHDPRSPNLSSTARGRCVTEVLSDRCTLA
jgi:hypothetical protein